MVANILNWLAVALLMIAVVEADDDQQWNPGRSPDESDIAPPELETRYGMLRGTYYYTEKLRKVFTFLSVPYAQPPVGNLRFEPPRPPQEWNGFLNATKPLPECLQLSHLKWNSGEENIVTGTEDCLYLNIYTPRIFSNDSDDPLGILYNPNLPVIVYIHGGGFSHGSGGSYTPKYLLDKMDAVFVTINYRLGIFGFLSLESEVVPGNMGLKDQVQALTWIRENIFLFGGDKNKVKLVGASAGAASVHFHYLSKLSRELFEYGMSMSGSALCPWALMDQGRKKSMRIANRLGCPTHNDSLAIECLRLLTGENILLEVQSQFFGWLYNPFTPFGPVVERNRTDESFLDDNPYDMLRSGGSKSAPWLVSLSADPGLYPGAHFVMNGRHMEFLNSDWIGIAPSLLDYNFTVLPKFQELVSTTIKDQYIDFQKPDAVSEQPVNFRKVVLDILGDRLYNAYVAMAAKIHSYHKRSNVFFYKFNYRGNNSYTKLYSGQENLGVTNDDELIYMFGSPYGIIQKGTTDHRMVDFMWDIWRKFFLLGQPEQYGSGDWYPVDKDNRFGYMNFWNIKSPDNATMEHVYNFGNQDFWMMLNIDELLFLKPERYYSK